MRRLSATAIVVLSGVAATVRAEAVRPGKPSQPGVRPIRPQGGATDNIPFSDNFDTYANGSALAGQGGWVRWDPALSVDGIVSNAFSTSAPNSLKYVPQSDMVQTGTTI